MSPWVLGYSRREKSLQESMSQTSHTHSMDELMVTNTVVPMSTRDDQRHGPDHTTKTKLPKSVPEASRRAHTRPLALGAQVSDTEHRVQDTEQAQQGVCYI